jgi:hypothetical protein
MRAYQEGGCLDNLIRAISHPIVLVFTTRTGHEAYGFGNMEDAQEYAERRSDPDHGEMVSWAYDKGKSIRVVPKLVYRLGGRR